MSSSRPVAFAGIAAFAAALGVLPIVAGPYPVSFAFILLITFVIAQSWDWVNGQMGYLNLGHYAFYGIGAYAFCLLLIRGVPLAPSFAAAIVVAALAAFILSFPLFRLKGDYFAFGTLTIVPLCELLASNLTEITKGSEGVTLPPNYVLIPAYYMAAVLVVLTLATTWWLMGSRFGYAIRAIRNDEQVAEVCGIRLFPVKVLTLGLSAMFAGLAGAIQAWQFSFIDPYTMFNLSVALVPIAAALLGGSGLLLGPLIGVILLSSLQQVLLVKLSMLQGAVYGLVIVVIGRFLPGGLLRWRVIANNKRLAWLARESHFEGAPAMAAGDHAALPLRAPDLDKSKVVLRCEAATMAFGGNVAVREVSIDVRQGEIVGLVGPNGSGKTTLFNLISGIYRPKGGRIIVDGQDISGLRADEIACLGIGRTYQIPRPFNELTVRECIAIGRSFGRGAVPLREAMQSAEAFARFVGLGAQIETRADKLSLQQKKALELARALAGEPKLLLVDEVASGLSINEIRTFVEHIREIRDRYGITVIWVEHIFSALARVVDRLVVLDSGSVIADAPLQEAVKDERVLATYLGHSNEKDARKEKRA
ncbi:branched-chain amino acid ABC transporter ATP-binding protein/permease [Roseiarcaceae bacterium H3SJ34-1]|uniref:branched-chain amino acid ABC transporter ATP-binding protein/permease n=1 Tax=Terripilifer ovatus TaxID=3032367 RepID=UPI003AB98020|nr:branched-chain amino acid ABC transporter ATP-binding protein/permease [Roseiarcaceae bacterium H3SJ34-1]